MTKLTDDELWELCKSRSPKPEELELYSLNQGFYYAEGENVLGDLQKLLDRQKIKPNK